MARDPPRSVFAIRDTRRETERTPAAADAARETAADPEPTTPRRQNA